MKRVAAMLLVGVRSSVYRTRLVSDGCSSVSLSATLDQSYFGSMSERWAYSPWWWSGKSRNTILRGRCSIGSLA